MSETLFKKVNYTVGSLIKFIELGTLGSKCIQQSETTDKELARRRKSARGR